MPDFKNNITQNGVGVSLAGHTHAGVMQSGTSFPVSPATNDLYHRDDLGALCQYDGTRWLGPVVDAPMVPWSVGTPWSAAATTHLLTVDGAIVIISIKDYCLVATTNNASNYWNVAFDNTGTAIVSLNTSSGAANVGITLRDTTQRVQATCTVITASVTKTGAPGSIRHNPVVQYRRIYT